jgi:hypothetical protein
MLILLCTIKVSTCKHKQALMPSKHYKPNCLPRVQVYPYSISHCIMHVTWNANFLQKASNTTAYSLVMCTHTLPSHTGNHLIDLAQQPAGDQRSCMVKKARRLSTKSTISFMYSTPITTMLSVNSAVTQNQRACYKRALFSQLTDSTDVAFTRKQRYVNITRDHLLEWLNKQIARLTVFFDASDVPYFHFLDFPVILVYRKRGRRLCVHVFCSE